MERVNVTLSLPRDLVQKVRHYAVDHKTSLSALVSVALEERIAAPAETYEEAAKRAIARMEKGFDMGGPVEWNREEIYAERVR